VGVVEVKELLHRHLGYVAKFFELAEHIHKLFENILEVLNQPVYVFPEASAAHEPSPRDPIHVVSSVKLPSWLRWFLEVDELGEVEVYVVMNPSPTVKKSYVASDPSGLEVSVPLAPGAAIDLKTAIVLSLLDEEAWSRMLSEAGGLRGYVEALHRFSSIVRGFPLEGGVDAGGVEVDLDQVDGAKYAHIVPYLEKLIDHFSLEERVLARQRDGPYLRPRRLFGRVVDLRLRLWRHAVAPPFMFKRIGVGKAVRAPDWLSELLGERLAWVGEVYVDGYDLRLLAFIDSGLSRGRTIDLIHNGQIRFGRLLAMMYMMDDETWQTVLDAQREWLLLLASTKERLGRAMGVITQAASATKT
jgi:hypothetical protein